jgi:uncharacterized protein YhjY with autotransporter beta-barrel domain
MNSGAASNFRGSEFNNNKMKSSRTLGMGEYNDSRLPSRDPDFLTSNIGRQFMRKSHGGATAFNNHQETVHSDNLNSYQFSGGIGHV